MKQTFFTTTKIAALVTVGAALALFASVASAWTAPTASFPGGNVTAPINTGSDSQTKSGGITASYFIGKYGLFRGGCLPGGACPIGTPNIFEALLNSSSSIKKGISVGIHGDFYIHDVDGQNPAAGSVLTADATGKATWQAGTSGLPSPANPNDSLRYNGTKWVSNGILKIFSAGGNPDMNGVHIYGNGPALALGGDSHVFLEWRPTNTGTQGTVGDRVWAGFGTANSKKFSIRNEFGSMPTVLDLNGDDSSARLAAGYSNINLSSDGSIILNKPGNYNTHSVGINTASPDNTNGTVLDINGKIKITGGNPGAGKVLTSDASGYASWGSGITPKIFTANSGSSNDLAVATCGQGGNADPAYVGGYAVGGGGQCIHYHDYKITESYPSSSSSWYVRCDGNDVSAYVICIPGSGSSTAGGGTTGGGTGGGGSQAITWHAATGTGSYGQSCATWLGSSYTASKSRAITYYAFNVLSGLNGYYTYPGNMGIATGKCTYQKDPSAAPDIIHKGISSGFPGSDEKTRCIVSDYGTSPGNSYRPVADCSDPDRQTQSYTFSGGAGQTTSTPNGYVSAPGGTKTEVAY